MQIDTLIIGAGAAGLICAIEAGKRGRSVILIDHSDKIAEKIRISGGGRCNFTNLHCAPNRYLSQNPHFCTSALKRYTQHDFIALVHKHGIPYHEKTLGQLFCDHSAKDIINMLVMECENAGVAIHSSVTVQDIEKTDDGFIVQTSNGEITASSLVIATGGPAIPKMGATGFGYEVAKQFGLNIIPHRAGLVPLTFDENLLNYTKDLSGVAVDPVRVQSVSGKTFDEAMLFTHRGISGPSILQISSYWNPGEEITINLSPQVNVLQWLKQQRQSQPRVMIHNILSELLPKRLAQKIADDSGITNRMADLSDKILQSLSDMIENWRVTPNGSEGYRTAEVALGGVDTDELSSKTFETKKIPGLYFIGEVVDVTGHLGGFNFQWAWSSGWCAGQYV
jgi:predicted Rossmann fold flavoprotein